MTCQGCTEESGELRYGTMPDGRQLALCYWCWVRRPTRAEPEMSSPHGGTHSDWRRLMAWEAMVRP